MKNLDVRILIGVLLIGLGGLAMLDTIGYLNVTGSWILGSIFVIGGAVFLYTFAAGQWWAATPGMAMLGLAGAVFLPGDLGGMAFLVSLGIGFWLWYLVRKDFWWAIIPGGVLITLGLEAGVTDHVPGLDSGVIFFLGLAVTFALVVWLAKAKWAWWPAGILAAMGLFVGIESFVASGFIWGAALMVIGGYLIFRTYKK
ncbi:MAG: hypothetical protein JXA13_06650 [Anaerolineales bacterium]|nr:hypothetical protein [Anaerolineales bacterium]